MPGGKGGKGGRVSRQCIFAQTHRVVGVTVFFLAMLCGWFNAHVKVGTISLRRTKLIDGKYFKALSY